MELIDKAALPEHKFPEVQCNGFGDGPAYRQGWNDAIDAIVENEPPVDAVPVRRGRWIIRTRHEHYPSGRAYEEIVCPFCGKVDHNGDGNFCGYCGAKADRGEGEENVGDDTVR